MKNLRKVETCAGCNHLIFVSANTQSDPICMKDDCHKWIDDELPEGCFSFANAVCDNWTQRVKTCGTCVDFRPETNTCVNDDSGEIIDPNDPHDCDVWQLVESESDEL